MDRLREEILPRLLGQVFHVTSGTAFSRIQRCGAILSNWKGKYRSSSSQSARSYGRSRGYVCLMDLRSTSPADIESALDCFYFLDPFVATRVNVFLILQPRAEQRLVPNEVGRAHSPARVVIPHVEVWYPGRLPLSEIALAIRVPMKRPGKWDHIDLAAFRTLFGKPRRSRLGFRLPPRVPGPNS
jgi:hypothetical protein